jgi:endo-1,4-beta-xylanase
MRMKCKARMAVAYSFVLLFKIAESSDIQNLGALAEPKGKFIGTFVKNEELKDSSYRSIIASACNMVTFNYQIWNSRIDRNKYVYGYADSVVDFGVKNKMTIRAEVINGDVLLPKWLRYSKFDREQLIDILQDEISAVAGHFKGRIYAWDVVNEIFNDDGTFRSYAKGGWEGDGKSRNSLWYEIIGKESFEMAFKLARRADPYDLLFIADYRNEVINKKSDAIYSLAADFKKRGVPLDGVAFHCHLVLDELPDWGGFAKNIQRFADLGLQIHFSEVDVRIKNPVTAEKLKAQAEAYSELMKIFLSQKMCTAFVMWGMYDKYSWIPDHTKGKYGSACLFDTVGNPKPAYFALEKTLRDNNSKKEK